MSAEAFRADLVARAQRSNPSSEPSKYVARLLESAKRRRLVAEEAFERRRKAERERQDAELGAPEMEFVTSSFAEKQRERSAVKGELDAKSATAATSSSGAGEFLSGMLDAVVSARAEGRARGAGSSSSSQPQPQPQEPQPQGEGQKPLAQQQPHQGKPRPHMRDRASAVRQGGPARTSASASASAPVDAEELIRRRQARLDARRAPARSVTPEDVDAARVRALERVGPRGKALFSAR